MENVLAKHNLPLGESLLRRRIINDAQLAQALTLQQRSGSRLGDILMSQGMVPPLQLYHAIAEHHRLPFVNLLEHPPEQSLLHRAEADTYLKLRAIPWRREHDVTVVAVCDPSDGVKQWIRQRFGDRTRLAITSPIDIRRTVETLFGNTLEAASRLTLWQKKPEASARVTLPPKQKQLMFLLLVASIASVAFFPVQMALAIIAFCHIAYAATMLFKMGIFVAGTTASAAEEWEERLASLDERRLPVYTVLIPMYREAASLPGMLDAMRRLDYPASKLDIKLVLEADDHETLQAAYALKPRYQFEIIRVPAANPRTKPKACNYALRFARGEYVTVFDADDRPERTQLKKAAWMFANQPRDVVCLQARLNYYNTDDNWLTRFFSLEYTILFHFMLYGLQRIGIPIPLGGTSNHISLKRLRQLGDWDPYNVTEDADLGTRLAARGYKTVMLDSFTLEEAPNTLLPWIRQRSRWIKGYMQTWIVHMRQPFELYRTLGFKAFIGFQFFVGFSSFTFLTAPLVWGLSILWMGGMTQLHHVVFPEWLLYLTLANLVLNFASHWYFALYCGMLYRRHVAPILGAALLYPLYLVFHSIASYKALWQLIVNPHYWEKTTHGLARHKPAGQPEEDLLQFAPVALGMRMRLKTA